MFGVWCLVFGVWRLAFGVWPNNNTLTHPPSGELKGAKTHSQ
jgi:hypothetical protein